MSNRILKAALLAAAAAACWACSMGNGPETGRPENGARAVRFASDGAVIQQNRRIGNRAAGAWNGNENIGIYMVNYATPLLDITEVSEGAANRKYTTAAAGETANFTAAAEQTIYYPANDANGNTVDVGFIAYHPHTATNSITAYKVPVNVSVQGDQSALDMMYANTGSVSYNQNTAEAVRLGFTHRMAKLAFAISNGDGLSPAALNGLTVTVTGQYAEGALNLADGAAAADTAKQPTAVTAKTAGDGRSSEAIVFPGDFAGNSFTFATTAGETFTIAIPTNNFSAWEAGKKYAYTVTLKKYESEITATITDWVSVNPDPLEVD